jgi:hypothetical protein
MTAPKKQSKQKIVHRPDGDYISFTVPPELIEKMRNRLTAQLLRIHNYQKRGRITADEAKTQGHAAIEKSYEESMKLFNQAAKAQGLNEAPIKPRKDLMDEDVKGWDSAVERTEANLQSNSGAKLSSPPS